MKVSDLGLPQDDLTPRTIVEEIYPPPETEGAQFLQGDLPTVASEILRIIKEKGVSL